MTLDELAQRLWPYVMVRTLLLLVLTIDLFWMTISAGCGRVAGESMKICHSCSELMLSRVRA
jgi:hypothetical protein